MKIKHATMSCRCVVFLCLVAIPIFAKQSMAIEKYLLLCPKCAKSWWTTRWDDSCSNCLIQGKEISKQNDNTASPENPYDGTGRVWDKIKYDQYLKREKEINAEIAQRKAMTPQLIAQDNQWADAQFAQMDAQYNQILATQGKMAADRFAMDKRDEFMVAAAMRIDPRLGQQAMMQLAMKRQAEGRGGFPQTQANNQVPPAIASRVTMLQNMAAMGNQTALGVLEKIKGMIMSGTASEMEVANYILGLNMSAIQNGMRPESAMSDSHGKAGDMGSQRPSPGSFKSSPATQYNGTMPAQGESAKQERLKLQSEIDRLQKQIDALRSAMQTMQNNNQ